MLRRSDGSRRSWPTSPKRSRSWESRGLLRTSDGPVDIYRYIHAEKATNPELKIAVICRVLEVSRSGYYDWCHRQTAAPGPRATQTAVLVAAIKEIHLRFRYYGSPRVHAELVARNHRIGRHRAARLMRAHGICAQRGKVKYKPRAAPVARRPDLVDLVQRDFHADVPNALWFTDITQVRTGEGWLFAAVVLDAFNREVISWATARQDNPRTVMRAFTDAIAIRQPPRGCLIHSDRGYQFTSHDWSATAALHGLKVSIGERKSSLLTG